EQMGGRGSSFDHDTSAGSQPPKPSERRRHEQSAREQQEDQPDDPSAAGEGDLEPARIDERMKRDAREQRSGALVEQARDDAEECELRPDEQRILGVAETED